MIVGCIYAIVDPRDSSVRYIGQTTIQPAERLRQHCAAKKTENLEKWEWIHELRQVGLKPEIKVLEEQIPIHDLYLRERHWVLVHVSRGTTLVNMATGAIMKRDLVGIENLSETLRILRQMVEMESAVSSQIGKWMPKQKKTAKNMQMVYDKLKEVVADLEIEIEGKLDYGRE